MSFRLLSSTTTLGLVALFTALFGPGHQPPGTGGTGAGASGGTGAGAKRWHGRERERRHGWWNRRRRRRDLWCGHRRHHGGTAGSTGGGGAGGSGGGASGPVTPTEASGVYTWSYGDVVFAVNAMVAGRAVTYTKGGVSALDATSLTRRTTALPLGQSSDLGVAACGRDGQRTVHGDARRDDAACSGPGAHQPCGVDRQALQRRRHA